MKATVTINRGQGNRETFHGEVIAETTTHYKVTHENNSNGEWFAKQSNAVNTIVS